MDEEEQRDAVKLTQRVTAGLGALILSIIDSCVKDGASDQFTLYNVVVQCEEFCKACPGMFEHVQQGLKTGTLKPTEYKVNIVDDEIKLEELE